MQTYCESCSAPLDGDFKGVADNYCKYCTDEKGKLVPREQVKQGIAHWLKSWQDINDDVAVKRAEHWMQAMPAWADE